MPVRLRLTHVSGSHSHWVSQSELAGRVNGPAEGQKDTSQACLRLLTASMRTRVNMVPSTDPRDLRARSMEAFAGVGEVQWVRLPELCFYRKNQQISQTAGTKMLVSQSIFRLLRNVVARWNQCLICGSLDHVP